MTSEASAHPLPDRAATSPAAAARSLLDRHWAGRLPVDLAAIAAAEGLRVEYLGFDDDFPFSGEYRRADRVIRINRDEAPVRQRFTLAHELGHYALGHADAPRDTPEAFSTRHHDPRERAANQFAAELLMPASAITKLVQAGVFQTVDELARAFRVSKVAMTYRINNLGLLV